MLVCLMLLFLCLDEEEVVVMKVRRNYREKEDLERGGIWRKRNWKEEEEL